jgi:UDP-N-acetylmuramyl pentapeptide phosphotransferase/UDP-N-acetylglucosamine-1-phosphate transferase
VTVLVALVLGLGAGWCGWRSLRGLLSAPTFARENHRGAPVPTAAGLVLVAATVVVAGAVAVAEAAGWRAAGRVAPGGLVLATVAGLALLGLVDDLAGTGADGRGFRAHLRALAGGRLTTGGLKLVGGGALALAVCAPVSGGGLALLAVDTLLVALAANAANLFDRAPGRALKVGGAAFVLLALATGVAQSLAGMAVVVGASLALLPADLRERLMLGDTGANALGGVLGLGVVLATAPGTRLAVMLALVGLNAAGEVVSFSRIIDAVAPLRALDRVGRRR